MKRKKSTIIRINEETKKNLDKLGKFGESYNDIIDKLIKKYYPTIKRYRWREEDQIIIEPIKKTGRIIKGKPIKIKKQK